MFFLSSNFVSGLQRTSSVSVSDGRKVEEKEVKQKFKNVSKNFFFSLWKNFIFELTSKPIDRVHI
jgi:hypothetical protein